MKLVVYSKGGNPQGWLDGIRAALPGAEAWAWTPGSPPADYALVWMPPQQLLDEQAGLKAIFNMGAGVDALLRMRLPAGVPLVRLEDAGMAVQMAEYVCHALIGYYRGFAGYAAQQREARWQALPVPRRADFTVGVMGLGVLGQRVARAVQGFDFPVLGWSRSARELPGVQGFHGAGQLEAFLAQTRVLVNLLPLTPETEGIIDRRLLAGLPRGAFVINLARGRHVVEDDLLAAIADGQIAGATLDVFREEPLPPQHPLWRCPQVTITPHISGQTLEAESLAQILGKIRALGRGEAIGGVVDTGRGY
ncbi:glyoxylate/hydroxypyruvate reductase A [Comamonas humi]